LNDSEFEKHTQGQLIDCAEHALDHAWTNFDSPRIHLRGHSEGALISLFVYQRLLTERPDAAARISSMILSGLALEAFETIVERQVAQLTKTHPDMRQAIESCDWPRMKGYFGLSCAYLQDAYARPSGRTMFETLAQAGVRLPISIFHGSDDWHTPARFVHELEAWNTREGKLDLKFFFYRGGHRGSDAAKAELNELLRSLTAPAPAPNPI
jgi:pimeloyl-ACP methyl ester carboxylesterase